MGGGVYDFLVKPLPNSLSNFLHRPLLHPLPPSPPPLAPPTLLVGRIQASSFDPPHPLTSTHTSKPPTPTHTPAFPSPLQARLLPVTPHNSNHTKYVFFFFSPLTGHTSQNRNECQVYIYLYNRNVVTCISCPFS